MKLDMTQRVLYLVANAFHIYVFYCMFRAMLGLPKSRKAEAISFIGMYVLNSAVFLLMINPYLNLLTSVAPLIFISLLYTSSVRFKLLVIVMTYATSMLLESVSTSIIFLLMGNIGDTQSLLSNIMGSLVLFLLLQVVRQIRTAQKNTTLELSHWLVIFIVPVGSIVAVALAFNSGYNAWENIITVFILLLINVIIFWLFDKMTEYYQSQYERHLLSEQLHVYARQLELIEENNQAIHNMRHDMRNHLAYLSEFLRRKEINMAQEYLTRIGEYLKPRNQYVKTGNHGLDSFLNYKLESLDNREVSIEANIRIPKQLPYPDFELCVILGNLLDNAHEALLGLDEHRKKELLIKMIFEKGVLYIRVSNSFNGKLSKTKISGKTVYQSLKENKAEHGRGLSNVERIVESFDGLLDIYDSDYTYTVEIILFQKI